VSRSTFFLIFSYSKCKQSECPNLVSWWLVPIPSTGFTYLDRIFSKGITLVRFPASCLFTRCYVSTTSTSRYIFTETTFCILMTVDDVLIY
jgi:hypothetical protein